MAIREQETLTLSIDSTGLIHGVPSTSGQLGAAAVVFVHGFGSSHQGEKAQALEEAWTESLDFVQRVGFPDIELRLYKDGDHRLVAWKDELAEESCRFFARWWPRRESCQPLAPALD
jgi:fermentation-respiration switch protein FrsA (DUF1100 family)